MFTLAANKLDKQNDAAHVLNVYGIVRLNKVFTDQITAIGPNTTARTTITIKIATKNSFIH